MQMDGWQDYLHVSLLGEHVLFPALRLDTFWHFILASLLTVLLCLFERVLTYAIAKNWNPIPSIRRSRVRCALWKSCLYWIVTLVRLLYMLLAMTFSVGLILMTVTSLSLGQFIIEYLDYAQPEPRRRDSENVKEPLLHSPTSYDPPLALESYRTYRNPTPTYEPRSQSTYASPSSDATSEQPGSSQQDSTYASAEASPANSTTHTGSITRPRSRSKPTSIFIHPNESNVARADAAALHLGVSGDTELVKGNMYPQDGSEPWEIGKGKDLARQVMGVVSK